jgi:hypothetical protein
MVDSPKLTVTMFSIIITQLHELQIPVFLVRLALGIEIETNFVEHPFSFLAHVAVSKEGTLSVDPIAQFRVFLVLSWHIACNAGKERGGVLVGVSKMKVTRSTAQKQLTVTIAIFELT